jgi:hypothetical protein
MRGRARAVALICGLVLALVPLGSASAHTETFDTTLSIDKTPNGPVDPGDSVIVHGRLKPKKCRDGQKVTLFKVRSGEDKKIDSDNLDGDGEYGFAIRPRSDMRVYAKVAKKVILSNYEHTHTCAKDRSPTISINVS